MAPQSTAEAKTAAASGFSSSFFLFMGRAAPARGAFDNRHGNGILPRERHGRASLEAPAGRGPHSRNMGMKAGAAVRAYRFPFLLPRENYGTIRLVSWNVNGFRALSGKPDWDWFASTDADVVALQETKAEPAQIAEEHRSPEGWNAEWLAAQVRKGYSGVAVFSRQKAAPRAARRAPRTPRSPLSGGRPPFAHRIPRLPFFQCLLSQRDQGRRAAGL